MYNDKKAEIEFYKDAMYYNLINKGYSPQKAEFMVKRFFIDIEKII